MRLLSTLRNLLGLLGIGIVLVGGYIAFTGAMAGAETLAYQMTGRMPRWALEQIGVGAAVGFVGAAITWYSTSHSSTSGLTSGYRWE